ncbi:ATP-dependent DNA helicase RecQ [Priestia megaterium]|uniref:DNA 3'-5' helicase n=1 Tax=Priestia megaterium TaxID=1404 RepID=A0A6H1P4M7_PRIMG|nr:helicase-related protein [Priestia megaterium]QIZ08506.1 ATP-dependent DNA helicase RecQ [Priestia megaterium]
MNEQFKYFLNEFINGKHLSNKSNLIVFKGFPGEWLSEIELAKLFSQALGSNLEDLHNSKMTLITEAVMKLNQPAQIYWCTFEELVTASKATLEAFCNIHIVSNNFYQYYFPIPYTINNLNTIYEEYYEDIDRHTDVPDDIQFISIYYGNILKTDNENFYVSYIDEEESVDLFPVSGEVMNLSIVTKEQPFIELSEDEGPFLDLIKEISKDSSLYSSLFFVWKGNLQQFSQNYSDRIELIRTLVPEIVISRYQKSTETKAVSRVEEYEDVLKRYWGYDHFRQLKMYKNVDDYENPKELTRISQAQIINDLVTQAELANKGNAFRDIFVTSPTGAGKSVMFQVPAVYLAERYNLLTIVISPLIGLMKDQVYGLQELNVHFSATINSEVSPVEKMNIMNRIANGEISILYISPETLLSRSDIKMLIGERKVGLFIIDEAHIVTTWGKAFRSDYWYLGGYLQKLRKEMQFPIATFTATAIYGGIEDMYSETRDSLLLTSPINYFGYVKRDDIMVSLKRVKATATSDSEYRVQKFVLLHERLKRLVAKNKKVLVYFPFVSFIKQFHEYMQLNADTKLAHTISTYYGNLKKEEKNDSFLRFKNNDSMVMLATKAFGMGIDIPDIHTVIHFSPTGNVCDYIQEIGRAARKLDEGKAYFDFLSKDFNHVKRLHGISTIRKNQLIQVMDKILMLYKKDANKKQARNLLISSEEFRYIFERNRRSDTEDDLDNKLKTALLIIEKDFINRIGFSPIIARPRSVFSVEYFKVKREIEGEFQRTYGRFVQKVKTLNEVYFGGIYKFNLKDIWETKYKDMSFPKFKYMLHQKDDQLKFKHIEFIEPVFIVQIDLQNEKEYRFLQKIEDTVSKIEKVFSPYIRNQGFFTVTELAKTIGYTFNKSKYQAEAIANQLIQSIISYQVTVNKNRNHRLSLIKERETQKETKYQVFTGLNEFINFLITHVKKLIQMGNVNNAENAHEVYLVKSNRFEAEKTFISLGILEMLDLLLYEVKGGDNPEIFIRINSKYKIENTIKNAENYQNTILNNVHRRHNISVAMLTYLFENEVNTQEFWDYIENYFLGKVPQEVLEKL